MKKFLLVCISLVISLLQPCLQSAHAQDVESFVRDFYKWYLKQSLSFVKQPQPLFEKLPVFDQDTRFQVQSATPSPWVLASSKKTS